MDIPDLRKVHVRSMPRLGGLAMAATLLVTLLLHVSLSRELGSYLLGAFVIVLAGLIDDRSGMNPKLKYLFQVVPCAVFVFGSGAYLRSLGDFLGIGEVNLGPLGPIVSIFCMAGITNAINLSDGLDGLAAGKCLIASCFLFVFGYSHGHYLFAVLAAALFGMLLGFLRFNSYPARLFMGDTGSLLLGYTMGVITVALVEPRPDTSPIRPISMAVVLGLPIIDTLVVMGRRLLRGKSIFSADRTHFHHRLLKAGFSHPTSVGIVYVIMFLLGASAWVMRNIPEWIQFWGVIGFFLIIYGILWGMESGTAPKERVKSVCTPSDAFFPLGLVRGISMGILIGFALFLLICAKPAPKVGLISGAMVLFFVLLYPWSGNKRGRDVYHLKSLFILRKNDH
jgi:UDP-GlcNAc:undecaprenyl-phosphate GlcNAc-1-phosphate transferase